MILSVGPVRLAASTGIVRRIIPFPEKLTSHHVFLAHIGLENLPSITFVYGPGMSQRILQRGQIVRGIVAHKNSTLTTDTPTVFFEDFDRVTNVCSGFGHPRSFRRFVHHVTIISRMPGDVKHFFVAGKQQNQTPMRSSAASRWAISSFR